MKTTKSTAFRVQRVLQSRFCGDIHQPFVTLIIRAPSSQHQSLLFFLKLTADYDDTLIFNVVSATLRRTIAFNAFVANRINQSI